MNELERLYIEVELKVTPFEEMGNTASMHVFERGIDCYTDDLYQIIYDNFDHWDYGDGDIDGDLQKLLDDRDNTLLCPLSCRDEVSYEDFLEWLQHKRFSNLKNALSLLKDSMTYMDKQRHEGGWTSGLDETLREAVKTIKPIYENLQQTIGEPKNESC